MICDPSQKVLLFFQDRMEALEESQFTRVFETGTPSYRQPTIGIRARRGLSSLIFSQKRSLWVILDFFFCLAFFYSGALLNPISALSSRAEIQVATLLFGACFCIISLGAGLYDRERRIHIRSYIGTSFLTCTLSLAVSLAIIYFTLYWKMSRYVMVFGSLGTFLGLGLVHAFLARLLKAHRYRFLILGNPSPVSLEIKRMSEKTAAGARYFHLDELNAWLKNRESLCPSEIIDILQENQIPDIILTQQASKDPRILEFCVFAMQAGCRVIDEIHFYSELFESFPAQALSESWLVLSGINTHKPMTNFFKRCFDFTLSLAGLVILSPFLTLIALLIRATSKGPALFIQERQGQYGKPIRVIKFRTMVALTRPNDPPSTRVSDPRITLLGRVLRPLHLDELPQLWNILKGEMSFVGPRPEVYSFTLNITKEVPIYRFRNLIRPGLTGLSQIGVGYTSDNAQDTLKKLAYDLYYLKNYNLFLDTLVLLRTIFVLTKRAR